MVGIKIEGLFGHFDYDILLAEGGMTILTGPNGYGKSTIINCIKALRDSELEFFSELDFKSIVIKGKKQEENLTLIKEKESLLINEIQISRKDIFYIKRRVRHRKNAGAGLADNVRDVIEDEFEDKRRKYITILKLMYQSVGEVECIEEQRLIRVDWDKRTRIYDGKLMSEEKIINVVDSIPEQLLSKMQTVANEYSRVANKLDSTYPERLFSQAEGMTAEEFKKNLDQMQEKVEKLNKYGISNISKLKQIKFQAEHAKALKVYFEDFERKYCEYEDLIDKLELFTDMVNRRFKFKKITVSNEKGVVVVDENGKELMLKKLSSGEKEILVLFYQLLFEVKSGVMLLLDEPEISLHIAWQRMFMEDLKKIVEKKNLRVLIATHSPQIINGNRKIQRDLGALYAEGFNKG